jgi:hypothetical protein
LCEARIGKRIAQERPCAFFEGLPAQPAQHPLAATGGSVAPPPKCCMVRAARQIPPQIKGPGGAIMTAPSEGACVCGIYRRQEGALPVFYAHRIFKLPRIIHQQR